LACARSNSIDATLATRLPTLEGPLSSSNLPGLDLGQVEHGVDDGQQVPPAASILSSRSACAA
jgi:hypothetical protein